MRNRTRKWANYPALRNDVVWIRLAEPSALEKVHNVCFAGAFLVETVLVLFQADRSSDDDFLASGWESVVRVVKDNLHCVPCKLQGYKGER